MQQSNLFDDDEHGLARHTDPDTSHEAAAAVDATRCEQLVLEAIRKSRDGLIAAELPALTGLALNNVSTRTRPLANKRLIYDSGERRTAPSGRRQIVWKAVTSWNTQNKSAS